MNRLEPLRLAVPISALLLVATLSGCAKTEEDGVAAYDAHNFGEARQIFERNGSKLVSQLYLSKIYLYGSGVAVDKTKAYALLRQSATQNNVEALVALADAEASGGGVAKDVTDAKALYQRAIALGSPEANTHLGELYKDEDRRTAERYLIAGSTTLFGKLRLAWFYETAKQPADERPSLAYAQMEAAVAQPDARQSTKGYAASELGEYLLYGYGTAADVARAREVLAPVHADHSRAKALYAWILFWNERQPEDSATAVRLWKENVAEVEQRGGRFLDAYTFFGLTSAYVLGRGTAPDPQARAELGKKFTSVDSPSSILKPLLAAKGIPSQQCEEMHYNADFEHRRYESLLASLDMELAQCNAASGKLLAAYGYADKAKKAGVAAATPLAGSIWLRMSANDKNTWLSLVSMMNLMDALPQK